MKSTEDMFENLLTFSSDSKHELKIRAKKYNLDLIGIEEYPHDYDKGLFIRLIFKKNSNPNDVTRFLYENMPPICITNIIMI